MPLTSRRDSSNQESVPPALIAFLESADYEDAIRKDIGVGGDSDTIACTDPQRGLLQGA